MKAAELREHYDRCTSLEAKISERLAARDFPAAFAACTECLPCVVPTIKARKQAGVEPATPDFLCFKTILVYGPPLFEHATIESLVDLIKSNRVLAKHENAYSQQAEAALAREEAARHIWNQIEHRPGFPQRDLGHSLNLDEDIAAALVKVWEELGIVLQKMERNGYALYLRSQLDAEASGMCPSCGTRATGRRELFFSPTICRRCGANGYYYLNPISSI